MAKFVAKISGNFLAPSCLETPHFQKFGKGVGGRGGLAQGNPSYARDSSLFSVPLSYAPLGSRRGHISGEFFRLFLGVWFVANPLPPTPFRNLWTFSSVPSIVPNCSCGCSFELWHSKSLLVPDQSAPLFGVPPFLVRPPRHSQPPN